MAVIKDRSEIIDAATGIIAFQGLDKLTLYHWYKSKDEILDEVFSSGHKRLMSKGFRLELEGSAEEVLKRAATRWSGIFSSDDTLPYLRAIYSLRYSDERAEEEARALALMIKSQIDVIMTALGYSDQFLSSLFTSLLLMHLEALLYGEEENFEDDAESFASLLEQNR